MTLPLLPTLLGLFVICLLDIPWWIKAAVVAVVLLGTHLIW